VNMRCLNPIKSINSLVALLYNKGACAYPKNTFANE